ncbi:MAG: hypothetical protein JKX74_01135 [Flavobacteriales bacterium]|nr:hypothetical protein [Flavobacteriales bacterium]
MNKVNAILLSLLLLTSTFGVSIEKHFCGGYLADVALFTGASCGCDEANMDDDCCHEENEVIKVDLDQFNTSFQRIPGMAQHDLLVGNTLPRPIPRPTRGKVLLEQYDLPPPQAVPRYTMNCSFTFYG